MRVWVLGGEQGGMTTAFPRRLSVAPSVPSFLSEVSTVAHRACAANFPIGSSPGEGVVVWAVVIPPCSPPTGHGQLHGWPFLSRGRPVFCMDLPRCQRGIAAFVYDVTSHSACFELEEVAISMSLFKCWVLRIFIVGLVTMCYLGPHLLCAINIVITFACY